MLFKRKYTVNVSAKNEPENKNFKLTKKES